MPVDLAAAIGQRDGLAVDQRGLGFVREGLGLEAAPSQGWLGCLNANQADLSPAHQGNGVAVDYIGDCGVAGRFDPIGRERRAAGKQDQPERQLPLQDRCVEYQRA